MHFYKIAFLDLSIIYSDNYGPSFPYLDEWQKYSWDQQDCYGGAWQGFFLCWDQHEIHGLQLYIFSLSSGKWRDLWELSHGRLAF